MDDSRNVLRGHFDAVGESEWLRLERDVAGRVSFAIHRRFLHRHVPNGARVLEVGAGPGRFTFELAAMQCSIVVTDLSPVQLTLNEQRVAASPTEQFVERREILDICDTSRYQDGEFDAVVAFGGPLSYVFDHAPAALTGLLRVTAQTGVVVASVMSWLGTWRHLLPAMTALADEFGEAPNDRVLSTGDTRHAADNATHFCQMYKWSDIEALVAHAGGRLVDGSASNWASLAGPEVLERIEADSDRWRRFLDHEAAACAQPGARDGGTHTLFAATHAT